MTLNPIGLSHCGLAIATIKAGGIGILDAEYFQGPHPTAVNALTPLLQLDYSDHVGIRLCANQVKLGHLLLQRLERDSHWLVVSQWTEDTLSTWLQQRLTRPTQKLVLEITSYAQILQLQALKPPIDGVILKGHESGGWVGDDSTYLLLQRALKCINLPIYVQGGIGLHTAAACRVMGVAGVVLDDQLWLMPESPLPRPWQRFLSTLNGQEAIIVGERLNRSCRVLNRPGFQAVTHLQHLADQIEVEHDGSEQAGDIWYQAASPLVGWGEPGVIAWPLGQAIGFAQSYVDQFATTGRFVQALIKSSLEHIKLAALTQPLQPQSALAQAHRTYFPIVQGPMTRVSDTAEFAQSVAAAGALPLLALALMRGTQVEALLRKTQSLLGSHSWGVGMLGFVSHSLREEQLKALREVPPPFALIAGGRPDQAAQFEAMGTPTYIHVPVPKLLKLFLEQGARKFVFEGRECGGHVGPLSSFILWDSMIETLLAEVPVGAESEIHVLFAGGIHDATSAAMVASISAPLVQQGMKVGVLMGTAYLFTEEAVQGGAILSGFQQQALQCETTINLESGPGHATRCAVTPFAHEFYATRRQMLAAGHSAEDIKNTLEDLNIGRLRIASKGLTRDTEGKLVTVDPERQLTEGMYMIGQVATLRQRVITVQSLHEEVCLKSSQLIAELDDAALEPSIQATPSTPSDIAIVGIGTLLPKAHDPETFWHNIIQKVDAITEIPADRWDWQLYYDEARDTPDKINSKWGGFIDAVPFDPLRFGIPPKSLKSISPMQLLALEAVRRALADAGYETREFDREHTSVILGISGGLGDLGEQLAARSELPRLIESPPQATWDRLPEWTSDTFPGVLLNVTAGRIANRFDLGGSNFTVDAACASSLSAIHLAVNELETGRANVAIAGGVDTEQSPFSYFCFAKTQALSPQGRSRSFEKTADGICISEGLGVVVLKRLADAERDGDRIYAVIKAIAGSSDGKALGMTAPLPQGQRRALERTYQKAGFAPSTLGLYEAHGTGTVAGDKAELETIVSTLTDYQASAKACAIGSVKTMIGHTKSTAGVAAMVKVALALHHRLLPPHIHVETPLDPIADPESPVYLLKEAHPWLKHPDHPRRGAVSAFGFGGTNFHAVLEEYRGNIQDPLGDPQWPCELLVFREDDRAGLTQSLRSLQQMLQQGAQPALSDLAYTLALQAYAKASKPVCLTVVVASISDLSESLDLVLQSLETHHPLPPYIQLSDTAAGHEPTIAFLFPGQGSQYPEMLREPVLYLPELREALELADQKLQPYLPHRLSHWIYPPSSYSEAESQQHKHQLQDTRVAQCALGALSVGLLDFLDRLGVKPAMTGGHSYGEYVALHTAGVLTREQLLDLSQLRGTAMAEACKAGQGKMASIQAPRADVVRAIQDLSLTDKVVVANHNSPTQTVISGDQDAVVQLVDQLTQQGRRTKILAVSGAFHSQFVAQAQAPLTQAIMSTPFSAPQLPVYSNTSGYPYDNDPDIIKQTLSQHMLSSVEFVSQIEHMHTAGVTLFIEIGPKRVLTNLVHDILVGKQYQALALDQGQGLRGLLSVVGTLIAYGVNVKVPEIFKGRSCQVLDLNRWDQLTPPELPPTTYWVSGGGVCSMQDQSFQPGKVPFLSAKTAPVQTHGSSLLNGSTQIQSPRTPSTTASSSYGSLVSSQGAHPMTSPTSMSSAHGYLPANSETNAYMASSTPMLSGDVAFAAYQAYQETMRQFLVVQERVMLQFLAGQSGRSLGSLPHLPTPASLPTSPPQQRYIPQTLPPVINGHQQGQPAVPSFLPTHPTTTSIPQAPIQPSGLQPQPTYPSIPPAPTAPTIPSSPETQRAEVPLAPSTSSATSVPTPSTSASTVTPSLDQTGLTSMLVTLVGELTGYPADMLGLDQDLEAELGIDSIKRVEIMGSLRKRLPDTLSNSLQEKMETFTKVKTLQGVVDQLMDLNGSPQEATSLGKPSQTAQPHLAT